MILRTAWVYSPFGANFVKTMLRLGATRSEVRVVADQRGSPTSALDIADALFVIAATLVARPSPERYGVFHMTGGGEATWAEFAQAIFAEAQARGRAPLSKSSRSRPRTIRRRPAGPPIPGSTARG